VFLFVSCKKHACILCWLLTAGALATLLDGKLVLLHAGTGSSKLDTTRSLDLVGLAASYQFTDKMKTEATNLLEQLEAWVAKQALSLDLAQNAERISGNFDSLLKVMDGLYQVRIRLCCRARRLCSRQCKPTVHACGASPQVCVLPLFLACRSR
jgi:hypothetical protein